MAVMVAGGGGRAALVAPPSVLRAIIMLALHSCDDTCSICALIHKCFIKVVDISGPRARVKLKIRSYALKAPNPVFIFIVMNALDVSNGVSSITLEVQLAVIVICPFYICQAEGQNREQRQN